MSELIPVHGELSTPVDRIIPLSRKKQFLKETAGLPTIVVQNADVSMIYRMSDGTLSPLNGPMNEKAWHQVLNEDCIEYNYKKYAWTIPLSLPITEEEANQISLSKSAILKEENGAIFGILENIQVFFWDKAKYIKSVYGTERTDHPGGAMVLSDSRDLLIGGDVWTLPQKMNPAYSEFMYSPRQTRLFIEEQNWERALAFQTRNPLHRAHEYVLTLGVEQLTREQHFTGVVLNPLVGELKGDDIPATIRMKCYHELLNKGLLGKGDKDTKLWKEKGYDLTEVFALIGLDIKMFYGGPKEAVMHAIYRQNHGFTDIVIGRKQADAPYDDGSPIWGDFDAHDFFDNLQGDLKIRPRKIGFAAYYESIGRIELVENHPDEKPLLISGSRVREMLSNGEIPDSRIIRPEIAEILMNYYQSF